MDKDMVMYKVPVDHKHAEAFADLAFGLEDATGIEVVIGKELVDRRDLVDELIEAVEKDKNAHSIDPVYDENVRKAIQAIRGDR